jgi:hypothetical protein
MQTGVLLVAMTLGLVAPAALAGPHDGGYLVPHLDPTIEYTSTILSYQGMSDLDDCEEAIVEGVVEAQRAQVWYVVAAFRDSPGPVDLGGVEFGFESYDQSKIAFIDSGPCNDGFLELPSSGWPGPREGTSIVFQSARREEVVEIYWFASYVYGQVAVPIGPRPGMAADVQFSSIESSDDDLAGGFGVMGFGEPGYNPCGGSTEGACCVYPDCLILSREECASQGGRYRGDNTDCFPDPCEGPPPIETTWGTLKKLYE